MKAENTTKIQFDSLSINEAYARSVVAAFLARYDPTVPQLADLKTAVSEAVTNCIVHAYPDRIGPVTLCVAVYPEREVHITVTDKGVGIPDVPQAMEPLFTTGNPEERSGLGFAVMQSFMDRVKVTSRPGKGTKVVLIKRLSARAKHSSHRIWGWCMPAPGGSADGASKTMTFTVRAVWGWSKPATTSTRSAACAFPLMPCRSSWARSKSCSGKAAPSR